MSAGGGVRVRVKIDIDDVIDKLDDVRDRMEDFRPLFLYAKERLQLANAENFTANGLPSGGWRPLSPRTHAWKVVHYPGAPAMINTGTLFRSLVDLNSSGANVIEKQRATYGTDVKYAKFHQYGTINMPKRQIVFTPAGFERDLAEKCKKYIVHGAI